MGSGGRAFKANGTARQRPGTGRGEQGALMAPEE